MTHFTVMTLTADQHTQIAKSYEKAAADHMVPQQQRDAFARKANWFHMLARLAAKKEAAAANKGWYGYVCPAASARDKADDRSKA